jgi:hypothetical protein
MLCSRDGQVKCAKHQVFEDLMQERVVMLFSCAMRGSAVKEGKVVKGESNKLNYSSLVYIYMCWSLGAFPDTRSGIRGGLSMGPPEDTGENPFPATIRTLIQNRGTRPNCVHERFAYLYKIPSLPLPLRRGGTLERKHSSPCKLRN